VKPFLHGLPEELREQTMVDAELRRLPRIDPGASHQLTGARHAHSRIGARAGYSADRATPRPLITLVLPFYNEAGYIERTLESLVHQKDRRFALILVDNASTDNSGACAARVCAALTDIEIRFLFEGKLGKINALATGLTRIDTPYLATIDADTFYPPDYVGNCIKLFRANPDAAAVMAIGLSCALGPAARRRVLRTTRLRSKLFSAKCHSGAYAQAFRTNAFRAAGGYDAAIWNFVLEDHEIVHRIARFGRLVYDTGHFCITSNRREDRAHVSWSLAERLVYAATPASKLNWFFHSFLLNRFTRRRLFNVNLRTFARRPGAPVQTMAAVGAAPCATMEDAAV
jgi:glycosyltransferase involved in cell wall biosynthesis